MRQMDDFENDESMDNLIDMLAQAVEQILVENEIDMHIKFPEGSMDPEIVSTFSRTEPVTDFYLLLHALKKVVSDLMALDIVDPDKEEDMINGIFEMVKDAILDERQQDED